MPPLALLAGGSAKRLHPLTLTVPKSLVEVAGTPAMLHIDYGLGMVARDALQAWPADGPFDLADFFGDLARRGLWPDSSCPSAFTRSARPAVSAKPTRSSGYEKEGVVIITRTPMRISIGRGPDLPSYYRQFGGFVISAAISKYVYITINRSFFEGVS